ILVIEIFGSALGLSVNYSDGVVAILTAGVLHNDINGYFYLCGNAAGVWTHIFLINLNKKRRYGKLQGHFPVLDASSNNISWVWQDICYKIHVIK
ncbi:hypothetical protein ACJX0J_018794, partial [Zea mays]